MIQGGRKSAVSQLTTPLLEQADEALRILPPKDLPPAQQKTWLGLVNSRPPEWFGEEHIPLLEQYCLHKEQADSIKRQLAAFRGRPPKTVEKQRTYRHLLRVSKSETHALIALGKSMRLTQSSVFSNFKSGKSGGRRYQGNKSKPWDRKNIGPITGQEVIDWVEAHCVIPEGKLVGTRVKLTAKEKRWIKRIYDSPTRTFILSMARKNAKTAFSSFLLLVNICGPCAKPNSQLYSTAQSRDQAAIIFSYAAKCARLSPTLRDVIGVRDTAKQLYCPGLGTLYRALSADVSTSFGLSPAFVVHDELGQVSGPKSELYEAIETAGAAQEAPLTVIISTQAPTDNDLLSILIDDAESGADPRVKVELYTAPMKKIDATGKEVEVNPFTVEAIRAANPHYDDFMNKEEVARQMSEAKRLPSRESSYRNLILNQRVEARSPFISRDVWRENGSAPADLKGQEVFGGLDLASVSDLCALLLVSTGGDVHSTFWLPEEGLVEKSRVDKVPYDVWAKDGLLKTTPGRAVEYEFIAEALRGIFDAFTVRAIAFDRYNMKHLRPWLERVGFSDEELEKFVEFGQGFISMSPALRELESRLLAKKLKHGNHPILTMCMNNASVVKDPAGNRKFTKARTSGRIDGAVALAMAVGVQPTTAAPPKKFQMMFI